MKKEENTKDVGIPKKSDRLEERSEQVQTIIDRMPTRSAHTVALIVFILMVIIITLSFVIKYPDTIDGSISISAAKAPVRLVAIQNGRLHLLSKTNEQVQVNQVLGYLDNASNYKHILWADSMARQASPDNCSTSNDFGEKLTLGEVSSVYNNFILAYKQYARFMESNLYTLQQESLLQQITYDSVILSNIDREIELNKEVVELSVSQDENSAKMLEKKAISEAEYNRRHSAHLVQLSSQQSLITNRYSVLSRISNTRTELSKSQIEYQENRNKFLSQLIANRSELINLIELWKQKYLFISPIEGQVEFLGFWKENTFIMSGAEIFSISPLQNGLKGEVTIPAMGAGKVKIDQAVNVKLHDYPFDEYGIVEGTVSSISTLSNIVKTKDGEMPCYLVEVHFPNGLNTNFGKTLKVNFETQGMAEIVVKPKRLIERLFDNLKSSVNK